VTVDLEIGDWGSLRRFRFRVILLLVVALQNLDLALLSVVLLVYWLLLMEESFESIVSLARFSCRGIRDLAGHNFTTGFHLDLGDVLLVVFLFKGDLARLQLGLSHSVGVLLAVVVICAHGRSFVSPIGSAAEGRLTVSSVILDWL